MKTFNVSRVSSSICFGKLAPTRMLSIAAARVASTPTDVCFPTSLGDMPFAMPRALSDGIGNTPLVSVNSRMYAKLEGHSPGHSIKDRTLSSIIFSMFRDGQLKLQGDTLCLVTSGSAGLSLSHIHEALGAVEGVDLNIVVVFPKAYAHKEIPAEVLALPQTDVFDGTPGELTAKLSNPDTKSSANVLLLDGVFMDVLADTKKIAAANGWQMLDQHYDQNSMEGHASTAKELVQGLPGLTDVVCATGTGATAAGLRAHLPAHIKVHSRPAISGTIDGLSDVQRYGNFCDVSQLEGYDSCTFDQDVAKQETTALLRDFNIRAGPSSGSTYWLAQQVLQENPDAVVAFLCADGVLEPVSARKRSSKSALTPAPSSLSTRNLTPFCSSRRPTNQGNAVRRFGSRSLTSTHIR